jgi:hypothetical protein
MYRRNVSGRICWDRLLLYWCSPHAYYYGNGGGKVANILLDSEVPDGGVAAVSYAPQRARRATRCRAHPVASETPVRSLFDFGEEGVESLAPGVFVFGQSGLEQTPEAKFAAHAKRAATVRALVRLVTGKRIS